MSKRPKSIVEIKNSDIRWKGNRGVYKESKKQRKLFEFNIPTASSLNVRQRSFDEAKANERDYITIDDEQEPIVVPEDTDLMISEVKNVVNATTNEEKTANDGVVNHMPMAPLEKASLALEVDKVNCPICTLDLTGWENYQKEAHAENCLEKFTDKKVTRKVVKRPTLPHIKVLEFNNKHKIVVDGFNFERDPTISQYFLSHFHADHYMGLRKSWDHGTIYGSEVTIKLTLQKFNMPKDLTRILPMNSETWFEPTISVIPLDANHCPGATVFLFQEWDSTRTKIIKQILHTGDFRSNQALITRLNNIVLTPIDQIYLDTTYLIPGFHFPFQHNVLKVSTEFCQRIIREGKNKVFNDSQRSIFNFGTIMNSSSRQRKFLYKCLFLVGTYTIGKEKLAISIAQGLKSKIYVPKNTARYKIVSQYIDYFPPAIITHDLEESCVHLVPLSTLRSKESIDEYFRPFSNVYEDLMGFIPTGWTFTNKYAINLSFSDTAHRMAYCKDILQDTMSDHLDIDFILKQYKKHAKYQIFKVPYSEHSSFKDLVLFGTSLRYKQILATVNLHETGKIKEMQEWFKAWQCIGIDSE